MACYLSLGTTEIIWLKNHAFGEWLKSFEGNPKNVNQTTNSPNITYIKSLKKQLSVRSTSQRFLRIQEWADG